jgi:hypothetical protein
MDCKRPSAPHSSRFSARSPQSPYERPASSEPGDLLSRHVPRRGQDDYRLYGRAEALGGGPRAQSAREVLAGLVSESVMDPDVRHDLRRTSARYRMFFYLAGQEFAGDWDIVQRSRRGMKEVIPETVIGQVGAMPVLASPVTLLLRLRRTVEGGVCERGFRA